MKRRIPEKPQTVEGVVFLQKARDLLYRLMFPRDVEFFDEEGEPLLRQAIEEIRALLSTSKEVNRLIVTDEPLWQELVLVLCQQIGTRLKSPAVATMDAADLIALAPVVCHDNLIEWALEAALAPILVQLRVKPASDYSLSTLHKQVARAARETIYALHRIGTVEMSERFVLSALLRLVRQELGDEYSSFSFMHELHYRLFPRKKDDYLSTRSKLDKPQLQEALEIVIQQWPSVEAEGEQILVNTLRETITWNAEHAQQDDSAPLTLVKRSELAPAYKLFWLILYQYNSVESDERPRGKLPSMFHARISTCAHCTAPLPVEQCWHRDAPDVRFCSTFCYSQKRGFIVSTK